MESSEKVVVVIMVGGSSSPPPSSPSLTTTMTLTSPLFPSTKICSATGWHWRSGEKVRAVDLVRLDIKTTTPPISGLRRSDLTATATHASSLSENETQIHPYWRCRLVTQSKKESVGWILEIVGVELQWLSLFNSVMLHPGDREPSDGVRSGFLFIFSLCHWFLSILWCRYWFSIVFHFC